MAFRRFAELWIAPVGLGAEAIIAISSVLLAHRALAHLQTGAASPVSAAGGRGRRGLRSGEPMQYGVQTNVECNTGRLRAGPWAQSGDNQLQCQLDTAAILHTPRRRIMGRHWRAYRTGEPQRSQARCGENKGVCARDDDAPRDALARAKERAVSPALP